MNSFKVSYVTTLPKEGNAPRVSITGDIPHRYHVEFYENDKLVSHGYCETGQTILSKVKQWFTMWKIVVRDEKNDVVFYDVFNPEGKVIFIKMDAYALGDSIAWIPYVDEFRKKHKCTVVCSTFHNHLFVESYPNILFVKPNTTIDNIYAQYYIGAYNEENQYYAPVKSNYFPLQMVASEILGFPFKEIQPDLTHKYIHTKPRIDKKYVTLSEYGSHENKMWKEEGGWQKIVDLLVEKGYEVLVISKEPTKLLNVTDVTGDYSLEYRAVDIMHAKMHFGISSGLSWLAWSMGTPVFMISDVTPIWHEFQENIIRMCANTLNFVDYDAEGVTKVEDVIRKLGEM